MEHGSGVSEGEGPRSVGATARLVGITVRTLHHYDQIGLVVPSGRTATGYRVYDDADVERLHRVLTYRELGFSLEQIATLLDDPSADAMAHLEAQHALLLNRIDRLHRMVASVEDIMNAKKQNTPLSAAEMAEIFGDDWTGEDYAAEAQERWGDTAAWAQSQERTARFSAAVWRQIKADTDDLEHRLADAMGAGIEPGSPAANALGEAHREQIEKFYDCGHDMQVCLAQMYLADPRFTAHYDSVAPGLAQYLHDVIVANAQARQG